MELVLRAVEKKIKGGDNTKKALVSSRIHKYKGTGSEDLSRCGEVKARLGLQFKASYGHNILCI